MSMRELTDRYVEIVCHEIRDVGRVCSKCEVTSCVGL